MKVIEITILILLVWHSETLASSMMNCLRDHKQNTEYIKVKNSIDDIVDEISYEAATSNDVKGAVCIKDFPTTGEMTTWINQEMINSTKKYSEQIAGFSFKNESPELLRAFAKLVSFTGDENTDNANHYKEISKIDNFNKAKSCETVVCAVETIFGKGLGIAHIYMLNNYGYNLSPYSSSAYSLITNYDKEQIQDLFYAVAATPRKLLPTKDPHRICRYKTGGLSKIAGPDHFSNSWANMKRHKRHYIAFHEAAHHLSSRVDLNGSSLDESEEWKELSKKNVFISEYAKTNPGEDLAETIAAYRFVPEKLKLLSKEKYDFVKKYVYEGFEFSKDSNCKDLEKLTDSSELFSFTDTLFNPTDKDEYQYQGFFSHYYNTLSNFKPESKVDLSKKAFESLVQKEGKDLRIFKERRFSYQINQSILEKSYDTLKAKADVKLISALFYIRKKTKRLRRSSCADFVMQNRQTILEEMSASSYTNDNQVPIIKAISHLCSKVDLASSKKNILSKLQKMLD
jgi:hypothetical protein